MIGKSPEFLYDETIPLVRDRLLVKADPTKQDPSSFFCSEEAFDENVRIPILDSSLMRQLPGLIEFEPEVMLFTAKSAIPMADVFRGFFDSMGLRPPKMNHIKMNWIDPHNQRGHETAGDEFKRLIPMTSGSRVAVVDQYIVSGSSLLHASVVARVVSGRSDVYPMGGRWYQEAYEFDIDFEQTTSVYAQELRKIGHSASAILNN